MSAIQELEPHSGTHRSLVPDRGHAEHRPSQEHGQETDLKRPATRLSATTVGMVIVMAISSAVGLFVSGWAPRRHHTELLDAESHRIKAAVPTVRVMKPRQAAAVAVVMLPGDVQAMEEITIYPRTTGYVKQWLVDIGDEVKEGDLLMEIDIPEVRAQLQLSEAALAESRASLERARASANLAQITTNRLRGLAARKAISQQELDDSENNLAVAQANVQLSEATIDVNKANVQHNRELLSFSQIRSPFAGTVTTRNVDTGKLVTAGNAAGQALFHLARTSPVRIFVNVPQTFAQGVTKDMKARIVSREMPGRVFEGTVTRTARSIDPLTRTLLTEIQVPNEDHALLTGSYVQIRMEVERQSPPLLIPAAALVFNSAGTQVAVVGADQKVHLRAVEVVGDFDRDVGIATGITVDDTVVVNPGDRMSDGLAVEIELNKPRG
jgi:RND family efflux transporter MFP subunit